MALKRLQNPNLLSMIGLGTAGGQPRADGSQLERGIHLRWQIGDDIGFPRSGFNLYRREQNLDLFLKCGGFLRQDNGNIRWIPTSPAASQLIDVIPSGESRAVRGCGEAQPSSILLPGQQTLRIEVREPARHIYIKLDGRTPPTPVAEAFWRTPAGDVTVDREEAQRGTGNEWEIRLFADQIDYVIVYGRDMILCQVCVLLVMDGYDVGWSQIPLNGLIPIYLPITHPDWWSPHAHSPDDQAEAESRLPAGLSADKRQPYTDGFAEELHGILYDLVGTQPQALYTIVETDEDSGATVDWPGLDLIQLMALDPNLARILGLYWHDRPPDANRYYDYRLVAYYGDTPGPGYRTDYSDLEAGARYGSVLQHDGLTYVSPNPIDVVRAEWDGSEMNALFIGAAIPNAPLSIAFSDRATSVTLYVLAQTDGTVKAYHENQLIITRTIYAGEKTVLVQNLDGLDTLIIEGVGDLTIFEIMLRVTAEMLEDVVYVSFHHRIETPAPIAPPDLQSPALVAARTGLNADGELMENQRSVGLRWELPEAGGNYLLPGAPILYHVRRGDLGNGEQPGPATQVSILNEDSPTLVTENEAAPGSQPATPRSYYTDRDLPDGWYAYQVRGIDLFGRLGEWSEPGTVRALDRVPPPPPQAVSAQYLDSADPWLGQADRDWAEANGPGLKVNWEWPGILRLQAPDVAPSNAEFRIYLLERELNNLSGNVNAVTAGRDTSELATDLAWPDAPDALAGESIRVGDNFFEIVSNGAGSNCTIEVKNLASPRLVPQPGACRIVFSRGRSYWIDYAVTTHWEKRLHAEPAVDIPIVTGQVLRVVNYIGGPSALIAQPGATRTVVTDGHLTDPDGVLCPGALMCEGVVYQAYGHTLRNTLQIHIVPHVNPTDSSVQVEPATGAAFTYYPGRRYAAYIAGVNLEASLAGGTATAHVAVSCSDGKSYAPDDPVWGRPGRGGLGGRPGNEGLASPACKVIAVKRSVPIAPANVPAAAEPIFAKPANYYGQAKYTLQWESVADAAGYALYRCSGVALFDHDRLQRQNRKDYYATRDPFADDSGFDAWLASYDSSLTKSDLIADPASHLGAWRAWAEQFYPQLGDAEVQALANRSGNEKALRRVNQDPIEGTTYADTFDGRGRGFYLYRVRAIDAAENLGAWSEAYPPVHIFDVTPPATPVVTAIAGGPNQITIKWAKSPGIEITGYLLYRTQDKEKADDWRQMELIRANETDAFTATVGEALPAKEFEFVDQTVEVRLPYLYGMVAVRRDDRGNEFRSSLSPAKGGQAYDLTPPQPPEWDAGNTGWVYVDEKGVVYAWDADLSQAQNPQPAVRLVWLDDVRVSSVLIARQDEQSSLSAVIASWTPGEMGMAGKRFYLDQTASLDQRYTYFGKSKSGAELLSPGESSIVIDPPS